MRTFFNFFGLGECNSPRRTDIIFKDRQTFKTDFKFSVLKIIEKLFFLNHEKQNQK